MANAKMSCAVKQPTIEKFRFQHPERKPGEIFLCDLSSFQYTGNFGWFFHQSMVFGLSMTDEEESTIMLNWRFRNLTYTTKRLGNVSYDINGNPIKGYCPVFVSKEEYQEVIASQR